jgi:hypothetical protein
MRAAGRGGGGSMVETDGGCVAAWRMAVRGMEVDLENNGTRNVVFAELRRHFNGMLHHSLLSL